MLGSAMDAEDMVQETYLRYRGTPPETIQSRKRVSGHHHYPSVHGSAPTRTPETRAVCRFLAAGASSDRGVRRGS
ncbi:MAG TPA: hypothetical protein VFQ30_06280 [Ktedonobacteraceae bacterium]|nr:hypothetical protein [Ktedonobacteraceae bacterium]